MKNKCKHCKDECFYTKPGCLKMNKILFKKILTFKKGDNFSILVKIKLNVTRILVTYDREFFLRILMDELLSFLWRRTRRIK